jgi:aminoglycoside phosphotransferase (APT) family kinase protein
MAAAPQKTSHDALCAGLNAIAARLCAGGRGIHSLRRLSGGASKESWYFEVEDGTQAQPMVLRRAAPGAQARDAAAVALDTEAMLLQLAAAHAVPVPAVLAVLKPEDGLGEGFVMQHLPGHTLGRKIVADAQLARARETLAHQCGLALARIHAIDVQAHALASLRRAPAPVERAHYEMRHRASGWPKPVFELALQWLKAHEIGAPPRLCLVHGDFRNGNLIVDETGLRAVLDWELAHLGDPMEDLGWICVNSWRFGRHDLPVGGFGTREQLFAGYREGGGQVDEQRVHHWEVLGTLKWGVMCEGMAQAWLSGAERQVERAAIGRRASEAEIDLLCLLAPRTA